MSPSFNSGFQRIRCPAGRVLGGSSSINYMLYTRGHPHDYDQWAAQGCEGWSYEEVLPYFLKSEKMENEQHVNSGHSSRDSVSLTAVSYGISVAFYSLREFWRKVQ